MKLLNLFSDENCVRYIIPLGFLACFVFSAAGAVRYINIMPKGTVNGVLIETGPPPLAYQMTTIPVNPLWIALGILAIILFTLIILFFAGVETVAVYTRQDRED